MKAIFIGLTQLERDTTTKRTNDGKRHKVKTGRIYVQGLPPYGYKVHIEKTGEGADVQIVKRTLVIDEEEAEVVKEIFAMYLSDRSISRTAIAKHLSQKGVTPPGHTRYISAKCAVPANAQWHQPTITKILSRKTYCGT